ncbi:MAG TPA: thioesterase family protein [Afifellaceae bacterium]|nr:thioesterase family protein [Afifellaceae bacterium]
MQRIEIGATGRFELVVQPQHLASIFKDALLPPVLATPVMVMIMENAALNAIRPFLEPGESAVGTRVEIDHLAATPVGGRVVGEATVTGVDGRHISFAVTARDDTEAVGRGTHERLVIDMARFAEKLAKKAAPPA